MDLESTPFLEKNKYYLLLIAVGLLVYFNSLFDPFILDDISQIQNNYLVHSIFNIVTFFFGSTFTPQNSNNLSGLYFRPLMTTAFSLLYTLFGQQTFFYHLFQLTLHIANTVLIFYLLKKLLKEPIAFVLSLIFLVHPINVESVVYISALQEPLFFFFGIFALILYQNGKLTIRKAVTIVFFLLCSLLSKETGILFALLIPLYYIIFATKHSKDRIKSILIAVVPISIYITIRLFVAKVFIEKIPQVPMMTASLFYRILTMPAIFFFYIKTFFFPKNLIILQEWMVSQPNSNFFIPLIIDVAFLTVLSGLGFWIWKTNRKNFPTYLFFFLWFILGIGFHMQLIPLDFTVSDRYAYFPIVGLLGLIGISVQGITKSGQKLMVASMTFIVIIICLFSLRTIVRNTNWYDGITLFSHDLAYQQNDKIENLLAIELVHAGQLPEAQTHFEALLSRNPNDPTLILNLAEVYTAEGSIQKAEETYNKGLSFDDSGLLYSSYTLLLYRENKTKQAKVICDQGLVKFPQDSTLWLLDAITAYKLGDKQKALGDVQKAKSISSDPRIDQIYQEIQNNTFNL